MMAFMDDINGFNWFMSLEIGRRKPIMHNWLPSILQLPWNLKTNMALTLQ